MSSRKGALNPVMWLSACKYNMKPVLRYMIIVNEVFFLKHKELSFQLAIWIEIEYKIATHLHHTITHFVSFLQLIIQIVFFIYSNALFAAKLCTVKFDLARWSEHGGLTAFYQGILFFHPSNSSDSCGCILVICVRYG